MVDRSRGASTSKKDEKRKDKPDAVDASKKPGTSSLGYFFKRQPRFHTRYFTRGSWMCLNVNSFSFDLTEKEKKLPTVVEADEVGGDEPMPLIENSSSVIEKDLADPQVVEDR